MIPFLPKKIANTAIYLYLGSLATVTILFIRHAMSWEYILIGITWVVGFFLLTHTCSKKWAQLDQRKFMTNLALSAVGVRIAWVVFSYFFYTFKTGIPFEFDAADSIGYWEDGAWLSSTKWDVIERYLFTDRTTVSDSGYVLYLAFLYKIITPNIFLTRIIKTLWSTATVLLIYNLAKRNVGEEAGRLSAIMACFMPNLIYYCGLHLKETEMIFLLVAFLERSDYLIRKRKYNVINIITPIILAILLFFFRTVLGGAAIFSFATALVFTNTSIIGRRKRIMLIAWGVLAIITLTGGTINAEVQSTWEERETNQEAKRSYQTAKGNRWAKYATGSVMAPMMFVMPFPTMVDVDEQYNQQTISGGNYVRNFLGGFVLLAVFSAIFITKNWRNLSLIGSFVIAYLGIISSSGFANSERFLLPALPGLLIMAAYGVSLLNAKNYRYVRLWYYVVPVMVLGWAFFKLGSRGLF